MLHGRETLEKSRVSSFALVDFITEAAVISFQKKAGLKQDGKYRKQTHAALMTSHAELNEGNKALKATLENVTREQKEEERQISIQIEIVSSDGSPVAFRCGNGSGFE